MFRIILNEHHLVANIFASEGEAEEHARECLQDELQEWTQAVILRPIAELVPQTSIVRRPLMS